MNTVNASRIGAKKFVLIHHDGCFRDSFHFRIQKSGEVTRLACEEIRTQHPYAIAVQLEGNFDHESTTDKQIESLKELLLDLKLRYPNIEVGAHRQVRGDKSTTCPGKRFPMTDLRNWAQSNLLEERDEFIRETIESQYRP